MTGNNSTHFPYQDCLVPSLPVEIQHQVRDLSNYVVRPLDMLFSCISFVCNTFVCITVARTKSLQQPSLLMLCNLAITDLIYSQFSLFMDIETLTHEHLCPSTTPEKTALAILCNLATLGILATISRDRYLAVIEPWWYRNNVTKTRAIRVSCAPWVTSVLITLGFYLSHKLEGGLYKPLAYTISFLFYCVCSVVIIYSYLCIFCKKPNIVEVQQIQSVRKREKRLATTVGLILLVLLLTFLPALLWPLVLKLKGIDSLQPYSPVFSLLFTVNTLLNPLVSFGRNKDMRKALRVLFGCSQQVQQSSAAFAT